MEINKEELKKRLTKEQYRVTQEHKTEMPFTGEYDGTDKKGMYKCVVCGEPLFNSDTKFNSGTGWPSFFQPATDTAVGMQKDTSAFMDRNEVHCKKCGAHLGHLFDDAPQTPTGQRFCINSASLTLDEKKEEDN